MKEKALKWLSAQINDDTCKSELDIIEYIKFCVDEKKVKENLPKVDIKPYFEKLWSLYPRKVNKQLAFRTFEHKVRGLSEEECREKCNLIYKLQTLRQKQWEQEGRDKQYYPHYSSLLNNEVPNSKYYKGR